MTAVIRIVGNYINILQKGIFTLKSAFDWDKSYYIFFILPP